MGKKDDPGIVTQAIHAISRIADSLDRLVALLEDLATAMGRDDWYGKKKEEED